MLRHVRLSRTGSEAMHCSISSFSGNVFLRIKACSPRDTAFFSSAVQLFLTQTRFCLFLSLDKAAADIDITLTTNAVRKHTINFKVTCYIHAKTSIFIFNVKEVMALKIA